jgi:undecaprenyl-diphosphatase
MFTPLETGFGRDLIVWLQAHGGPLLDVVAQVIAIIGVDIAYLLLLLPLLLTKAIDRRRAYQWIFTLVVTTILTDVVKLLFRAPRPYQIAPELVRLLINPLSSYGFPSGHVSHALAMFGLAAVWGGKRWRWIPVALYTLLVAWARMYAGVHYPQDVIGGAVVGLLSLWISLRSFERFMDVWTRLPMWVRVALVVLGLVLVVNVPGI